MARTTRPATVHYRRLVSVQGMSSPLAVAVDQALDAVATGRRGGELRDPRSRTSAHNCGIWAMATSRSVAAAARSMAMTLACT